MRSDLHAHTVVMLKFLARSRVLIGFVLVIGLVFGIGLVPAFFFDNSSNRFELLKQIAGQLHGLAGTVTAGIGLMALWSHRRARSIKMIATKPSPFEGWIASIFVAAAMVGVVAHVGMALITFGLSLYWGVPYQAGFAYLAADRLFESLIGLGLLTALSAFIHPVIAVILLLFFNDSTFQFLGTILEGAFVAGRQSVLLSAGRWLVSAAYYAAPALGPFDTHTKDLESSLRVSSVDLYYLACTLFYALLACGFGYVATLVTLRRRSLA